LLVVVRWLAAALAAMRHAGAQQAAAAQSHLSAADLRPATLQPLQELAGSLAQELHELNGGFAGLVAAVGDVAAARVLRTASAKFSARMAEGVQALGAGVCAAFPVKCVCNDPACDSLEGLTEAAHAKKTCSGCKVGVWRSRGPGSCGVAATAARTHHATTSAAAANATCMTSALWRLLLCIMRAGGALLLQGAPGAALAHPQGDLQAPAGHAGGGSSSWCVRCWGLMMLSTTQAGRLSSSMGMLPAWQRGTLVKGLHLQSTAL
jgi:hypothetical protein